MAGSKMLTTIVRCIGKSNYPDGVRHCTMGSHPYVPSMQSGHDVRYGQIQEAAFASVGVIEGMSLARHKKLAVHQVYQTNMLADLQPAMQTLQAPLHLLCGPGRVFSMAAVAAHIEREGLLNRCATMFTQERRPCCATLRLGCPAHRLHPHPSAAPPLYYHSADRLHRCRPSAAPANPSAAPPLS